MPTVPSVQLTTKKKTLFEGPYFQSTYRENLYTPVWFEMKNYIKKIIDEFQ